MSATLFGEEPDNRAGNHPVPPRHYARILRQTGLDYGLLDQGERRRIAKLAARLRANGIPDARITEEGTRLRAALGRRPSLGELAARLLP